MDKLEVARLSLAGSRILIAHAAAYKREFVFRAEDEGAHFVFQAQSKEEFEGWLALFRYYGVHVLPMLREGFLHKKGKGVVAVSSRRYFVLYQDNLMWFKDEAQPRPIDMVPIRDNTSVAATTNLGKLPGFSVETPKVGRKYLLAADTAEDRDRWINTLEDAKLALRPVKEGFLFLMPPTQKGAKRLRAVLLGSVLRFYDDKDTEITQETVALRATSKLSEAATDSTGSLSCTFDLWHLGVTVRYWSPTELQKKDWMEKIAAAISSQEKALVDLEASFRNVRTGNVEGNFLFSDGARGFVPVQLSIDQQGEMKVLRAAGDMKVSRAPDEVKSAGSGGESDERSSAIDSLAEAESKLARRTSAASQFLISGYLNKLSSSRVSQKRFFALTSTNLCYWTAERDSVNSAPKTSIPLLTIAELVPGKLRLDLTLRDAFGLSTTRVLNLIFPTQEVANQWQTLLNEAIARRRANTQVGQAPAWLEPTASPPSLVPSPSLAVLPTSSTATTAATTTAATAPATTPTPTAAAASTPTPLTTASPSTSPVPSTRRISMDSAARENSNSMTTTETSTNTSTNNSPAINNASFLSFQPLLSSPSLSASSSSLGSPRVISNIKESFEVLVPVLSNPKVEALSEAQNFARFHSYSLALSLATTLVANSSSNSSASSCGSSSGSGTLRRPRSEKKTGGPATLTKAKSMVGGMENEKARTEVFLDEVLFGKFDEFKIPEVLTLFIFQTAARGDIPATACLAQELRDDLDITDGNGNTLLHVAAAKGKVDMVKLLVEHYELDLNELNNEKLTALQVAEREKQPGVVVYLRNAFMVVTLAVQALFNEDNVNVYLTKVVEKDKARTTSGFALPDGGTRPMTFHLLSELMSAPRYVSHKSLVLSQLTLHMSCPKLPLRQKLFGESKPNPLVCILSQASDGHAGFVSFSTEVVRKNCSPVFSHVAVYFPILTPSCDQSFLVGVFDDGPDTIHLIGFARVHARELIGSPTNTTKTLTVPLSKPAAKDDGFQKTKEPWTLCLESKAVYYTLVEQIDNAMLYYHTPCASWDRAKKFASCKDHTCLDRNKVLEMLDVTTAANVIQETFKCYYLLLRVATKIVLPLNEKGLPLGPEDSDDEQMPHDDLSDADVLAPLKAEDPDFYAESDTDPELSDHFTRPALWAEDEEELQDNVNLAPIPSLNSSNLLDSLLYSPRNTTSSGLSNNSSSSSSFFTSSSKTNDKSSVNSGKFSRSPAQNSGTHRFVPPSTTAPPTYSSPPSSSSSSRFSSNVRSSNTSAKQPPPPPPSSSSSSSSRPSSTAACSSSSSSSKFPRESQDPSGSGRRPPQKLPPSKPRPPEPSLPPPGLDDEPPPPPPPPPPVLLPQDTEHKTGHTPTGSRLSTLQMESDYMRNKAARLVQFINSAKPGIMIRVFQNVCNTVANYRSFCREINREIHQTMNSLRNQHKRLSGFVKECDALSLAFQQIAVKHTPAHSEWSSGFPEDLGIPISELSFVDKLAKLRLDKSGTRALHQLIKGLFVGLLRMCRQTQGRHRRGASGVTPVIQGGSSMWLEQSLLPDVKVLAATAGQLDGEADSNVVFRKRLVESLVLVGYLKRELEAAFSVSVQSIKAYLQTKLQSLEKELKEWEVEMKFFKQFHSDLFEHVCQAGTQAYQTTMRRVKEVKLAIYKLSAEALEQALTEDKTGEGPSLDDLDSGLTHTVERKPLSKKDETVAKLKQEYKILKDEQEYLYNTFIFQDQHINTRDGTSGLDTAWYIPLSDLRLLGKIGSGEYGDIFRGTNKGIDVAIKVVKDASSPSFTKEFNLWSELKFPYVIQLLGYTKVDGHLAMVMPFCEISLEDYLATIPPLKEGECDKNVKHSSWKLRLKIAHQIALGMAYLHDHQGGVLHRDLKAANVLLHGSSKDARICDFGFSKKTSWARSMSGRGKGSPITMAPEVYTSGKSTKAADVYSFGIVLWEIVYCQSPYSHLESDLPEVQFMDLVSAGNRPKVLSEDLLPDAVKPLQDLFQDCWQHKADRRPTFAQLSSALGSLQKGDD